MLSKREFLLWVKNKSAEQKLKMGINQKIWLEEKSNLTSDWLPTWV